MSWLTQTLSSTIGKKLLMALTGLFLILFLVVHLAGNLQLLFPDGGEAFNLYAHKMGHNPLIRVVSILNFSFIFLHALYALLISRKNSEARPVKYHVSRAKENSVWSSRNMGILGTLILVFILIHLKGFWYEAKFGSIGTVIIDGEEYKNVYAVVADAYSNILYVIFYVASMVAIAFHLSHGFQSAFQTLGLNHKKYTPLIHKLGAGFSIIVPLLFAVIPIYMYVTSL